MYPTDILLRRFFWALMGLSLGLFAAYVAWLVVPIVVRAVVPAVVRTLNGV